MKELPHNKWEKLGFFLVGVCTAVTLLFLLIDAAPQRLAIVSCAILLIMVPLAAYVFWRRW
jgi:hypothetical protein